MNSAEIPEKWIRLKFQLDVTYSAKVPTELQWNDGSKAFRQLRRLFRVRFNVSDYRLHVPQL